MPATHRRKEDPKDTEFTHQRGIGAGDKILRWGFTIEKWFRLLWPALVFIGGLFMATVWQPLRSIPDLQAQVQQLADAQQKEASIRSFMDSLSFIQRTQLAKGMQITNRILCFNMDRADRIKYDIDCSNIPLPEIR